jgi:hypothetical protein
MRRIRFKLKDLSRCRSGSAVPALAPQCLELAFELGDRPGDLSRAAIRCRSPVVGDARDRAVPLRLQCLETRFEFRKSSHHPDALPVTDFEPRELEALKAELDAEYRASFCPTLEVLLMQWLTP